LLECDGAMEENTLSVEAQFPANGGSRAREANKFRCRKRGFGK